MEFVFACLVVLLVLFPLRPLFLRCWRFTLPGMLGAILGFVLAHVFVMRGGNPWWLSLVAAGVGFFVAGEEGFLYLSGFGSRKEQE